MNDPIIDYTLTDLFESNPQCKEAFDITEPEFRAAYLYASPYSIYKNMLNHEKEKTISEEVLNDPDFDWSKLEESITKIINLYPGKATRYLLLWEKDFEDRLQFLSSIQYSKETPMEMLELKEKWSKDTHNMWKHLMASKKDVAEEQAEGLGGSIKSAEEAGLI